MEYEDYQRVPASVSSQAPGSVQDSYSELGDRLFHLVDESLYQQEKFFKKMFGFYRKPQQPSPWF